MPRSVTNQRNYRSLGAGWCRHWLKVMSLTKQKITRRTSKGNGHCSWTKRIYKEWSMWLLHGVSDLFHHETFRKSLAEETLLILQEGKFVESWDVKDFQCPTSIVTSGLNRWLLFTLWRLLGGHRWSTAAQLWQLLCVARGWWPAASWFTASAGETGNWV